MKKVFLLITLFSIASLVEAQTDRFQNLKDQRNAAIERATAPINARYVSELKKLLTFATKSGKLEEAVKIKAEIALFEKESRLGSGTSSKKEFTKDYLVGTKWEQNGAMFKFEKGRFQVFQRDSNGEYVAGGYRNWEILDVEKRKINIFWNTGPDIATLNSRLTKIESSKPLITLIEEN